MVMPPPAATCPSIVSASHARYVPAGTYHAWLVDTDGGETVGGAGATIIPWPPGPRYPGTKLAFVYNVYTEPAHRRRGLAKQVMETIHAWCAEHGVTSIALNASVDGRALYESMGYVVTPSPMMFFSVVGYNPSVPGENVEQPGPVEPRR